MVGRSACVSSTRRSRSPAFPATLAPMGTPKCFNLCLDSPSDNPGRTKSMPAEHLDHHPVRRKSRRPMISLQDVLAARDRIRGNVAVTPCPQADVFSEMCGAQIYFKLENLQRTGSFKERGAANKLALLSAPESARGVVAASAGNHAQGVGYNAQRLGVKATIVMPETTPFIKVQATKKLGAQVELFGVSYDDAYGKARELEAKHGYVLIHAFDDDAIIAGQGTCALEILEQVPEIDVLIASIGGGGWLGGMALAIKSLKPSVRVIGVESSLLPKMRAALDAGGPVLIPNATTLADGIAVKRAGERTLPLFRKYVDEIVGVDDEEVANAILLLIEREKTVAEGAGAAPAATVFSRSMRSRMALATSSSRSEEHTLNSSHQIISY